MNLRSASCDGDKARSLPSRCVFDCNRKYGCCSRISCSSVYCSSSFFCFTECWSLLLHIVMAHFFIIMERGIAGGYGWIRNCELDYGCVICFSASLYWFSIENISFHNPDSERTAPHHPEMSFSSVNTAKADSDAYRCNLWAYQVHAFDWLHLIDAARFLCFSHAWACA